MAQYVYDMSKQTDIDKLMAEWDTLKTMFTSKKFKSFIADKCLDALKVICNETTFWDEHEVWTSKLEEYKNGHKVEIGNDYVLIFNDTYYIQDELYWLSPKTKKNYPEGISVSYLIEYGMGINGTAQDDWEVNVPTAYKINNGQMWYGNSPSGQSMRYYSQEGKFIYQKLANEVELHFEEWANEYYEKVMK